VSINAGRVSARRFSFVVEARRRPTAPDVRDSFRRVYQPFTCSTPDCSDRNLEYQPRGKGMAMNELANVHVAGDPRRDSRSKRERDSEVHREVASKCEYQQPNVIELAIYAPRTSRHARNEMVGQHIVHPFDRGVQRNRNSPNTMWRHSLYILAQKDIYTKMTDMWLISFD
jgi:hypothetical protein